MQHCSDLGIVVDWKDLGEFRRGEYRRRGQRITLNTRLMYRQATATLGHELGHHRFGDTCSTPRNERRAWEYGAALLIEPDEYRVAETRAGCHPAAIALELDVTPKMIEAWRRWWLQRGRFLKEHRHLTATIS